MYAGIRAHSLALISDAGHNATDALALLLASFAFFLQSRGADERKTYGYHRAGVLAAFLNALVLVLLSLWIFWESYQRLLHPGAVAGDWMMSVAAGGLLLNGGIMWGLRGAHAHDINVRSAFVHMLGDLLGAAAILIGGALIGWTGWLWIDPALSILIAALIVWTAWDIIQESLNILLEGLPRGLELAAVQSAMCCVRGVLDVHDLHIWSIGSSSHALELPRADRRCSAVGQQLHSARHQSRAAGQIPHLPHHRPVRACELRGVRSRLRHPGGRRNAPHHHHPHSH